MESGSERSSTITKLRDRKVVQWTLAYLTAAWALLQIVDVFSSRFDWPSVVFRALTAILGVGFFAAVIVAWYHGEKGRQSTTGLELLMLAAVFFVAGIAAVAIGPEPKPTIVAPAKGQSNARYRNSPGYDLLTRGRVVGVSENVVDNDRSIKLLEQAIAADPNLAPAYAELARAYRNKAFYFADDSARGRLNEDAEVAVSKALELDPALADAHYVRGLLIWTDENRFPHKEAIASFKRAIALDPNHDEAHHQLGLVYNHVGLLDEARAELQKALAINPANTLARFRLGGWEMYRGNYENAYAIFHTTPLRKTPSLWASTTATALLHLNRRTEAQQLIDEFLAKYRRDEGGLGHSVVALLCALQGDRIKTNEAIHAADSLGRGFGHFHHTAYNIATAHALLKQPDSAVRWLQSAVDNGFPNYPYFANDSYLDNIRGDARFQALMTKLKKQSYSVK